MIIFDIPRIRRKSGLNVVVVGWEGPRFLTQYLCITRWKTGLYFYLICGTMLPIDASWATRDVKLSTSRGIQDPLLPFFPTAWSCSYFSRNDSCKTDSFYLLSTDLKFNATGMLNPSTAFQTTTTNHWQLCSISTVLASYKLSRIRVPFGRGFLRISISILYPSISVTASGLIISLIRTSGTLLRARLAQHGSLYQANVLSSLVMCMPCSRRAPTGACDTIFYATILPGFPPTASVTLSCPSWTFPYRTISITVAQFRVRTNAVYQRRWSSSSPRPAAPSSP